VPPGKVTATLLSAVTAPLSFSAFRRMPSAAFMPAPEMPWPLVFSRARIAMGSGLLSDVMRPACMR
jgi:hypothetical protein